MTDTIIKQYGKRPNKEYIAEFYNYVFQAYSFLLLNNNFPFDF